MLQVKQPSELLCWINVPKVNAKEENIKRFLNSICLSFITTGSKLWAFVIPCKKCYILPFLCSQEMCSRIFFSSVLIYFDCTESLRYLFLLLDSGLKRIYFYYILWFFFYNGRLWWHEFGVVLCIWLWEQSYSGTYVFHNDN